MLAAVVDPHHVGVRQTGGGLGLPPEALDELLVLGEAAVQHLQRHLAAEMRVLRRVDVGHAAGSDAPGDPVAAVDERAGRDLGHSSPLPSIASSTCLAIGAATVPP